ncbi:DNA-binding transcriptional LysR family regulator [Breznakia sp. PF5-3]|uniref:LysR family transcriptional regulator n=1 Tax=unclassified Breznakia TaxID=2623764 RepID=UPI002405028F|nr:MULTISPECIES: LysR family transcriptional regulator [unclassified Breznakia]MDF9824939.1 DNA-binding transcriptional LysR family regulator [Breznakia sp. PM6-1]MDF9835793.1 DNA-binding transcriptional LysR family regulator [Breznakia sp. PF5-3]MDF9837913.1 DNA-binding transcriptional LysR family regulator [Breznakia sp. PFB2-8]MDF9859902.1 DNA-binding transcriptional LysR family regulator [Breznakia sp. PH5-24]
MKTKLDNYRIFYEVATNLSFSNAAKSLYISQSAVSQSIKQLENDLECQLFHRYSRKISLTQEGTILYDYIKSAMESIDVAEQKINNLKSLDDGSLIIGAADTITSNFLLPYLEQFHFLYPNIHLQVFNATSIEMIPLVKSGKVDIAFANLPIHDDDLYIQSCADIHDIFVCSSRMEIKDSYTRKEIAELPLILLEKNSNSRLFVEEEFLKTHISLNPHIEIGAHELLLQLASINLGVSCVIKEFSTSYLEQNKLKELTLKQPLPSRSIGYIQQRDFPLSTAAETFIKLINKTNI